VEKVYGLAVHIYRPYSLPKRLISREVFCHFFVISVWRARIPSILEVENTQLPWHYISLRIHNLLTIEQGGTATVGLRCNKWPVSWCWLNNRLQAQERRC